MSNTISMLILLIIILFCGWLAGKIASLLKLPSVLGMTIYGMAISIATLGKYPQTFMDIKPILTTMALIIILLRAGLGIKRKTLNKIGIQAILMGFIPCLFEGVALTFLFHYIYKFDYLSSGITGFLLSAVSPAIVVPSMLEFKEKNIGAKNDVPTLVLAGASLDDVFAITIFTVFINMSQGENLNIIKTVFSIPINILGGVLLGLALGFIYVYFFRIVKHNFRDTEKALILFIISLAAYVIGELTSIAGLLAIMAMGFIILEKDDKTANIMAYRMNKIWVVAEIILFVLIGMSVDVSLALNSSLKTIGIIFLGLVFRSIGVTISLIGSKLSWREKLFCALAYTPKATVQAAMGAIPLSLGLPNGELILATAVTAIIVTAPLGLILIKTFGHKLLVVDFPELERV